jgi:hypothetical protein
MVLAIRKFIKDATKFLLLLLLLLLLTFVLLPTRPVSHQNYFGTMDHIHSVGLLETMFSPVARPLPTHDKRNTKGTRTDIQASSGIRTYGSSVWAGEIISCLRPRGHCDRPPLLWEHTFLTKSTNETRLEWKNYVPDSCKDNSQPIPSN